MKTIHLEVEDSTYQTVLNFIKLLPENRCRVLEPELSTTEQQHVHHCLTQIKQGNYSEFEDFDIVKNQL
ncbi:MAG: hypothetical protein GQ569_14810 [Methylococcaceae bacterium]|nr:hypothetical protein [Methylococcaceae bacterium]